MTITTLFAFVGLLLSASDASPNVLFISVDDLRPELGAYGFGHMHTPTIDGLASNGTVFRFAYSQMTTCSPSRASVMTSLRPDVTRVHDLATYFRNTPGLENVVTLPQYFKENGYRTAGFGKIFHPGAASGGNNDIISWTERYTSFRNKKAFQGTDKSWQAKDDPEADFPDAQLAAKVVTKIARLKKSKFFIAAGFSKPHLPFVFPSGYLDYYPENTVDIAANPYPPEHMPSQAWTTFSELRGYDDVGSISELSRRAVRTPGKHMPDDKAKELRRAYWATTSFVDNQIGVILKALKDNDLEHNTTVVLWSDHGWQLGELGLWAKATNFELSTRSVLIIRAPKVPSSQGKVVENIVEHLDVYPTLLELANLPPSASVAGKSMVSLMDGSSESWKDTAFSQFTREVSNGVPNAMGYTVRTPNYRYTEWLPWDQSTFRADWTNVLARELYNHSGDDGKSMSTYENINLANLGGAYNSIITTLGKTLCSHTPACTRE